MSEPEDFGASDEGASNIDPQQSPDDGDLRQQLAEAFSILNQLANKISLLELDRAPSGVSDTEFQWNELRNRVDELFRRPTTTSDSSTSTTGTSSELVHFTSHAGSGTTPASFTYSFTTSDGVSHTTISPSNVREQVDLLAGTYGLWSVNPTTGAGTLIVLDETIDWAACT